MSDLLEDQNSDTPELKATNTKERVFTFLKYWKLWIGGGLAGVLAIHSYTNPDAAISAFFFEAVLAVLAVIAFGTAIKGVGEDMGFGE